MAFTKPTAAQINFDVTNISDPLICLNYGQSGTPDDDVGIIIERGSSTNVALIWDESADTFALINTAETGSTAGNVTIASYAGLTVGQLSLADSAKIYLGTGNDLELYHNGNNSFISDQGTGGIYILTNDFLVKNAANNETFLRASGNGDVELYYDNSQKLVTTTTGISVTGAITATGTDTSALLTLTTTEASASASPVIVLKRNSGSPADSDSLGQIKFLGENDADEEVEYGRITTTIFDASNGSEDGKMQVKLMEAGTLTNSMRFEPQGIFLNTSNTITFEGATADNYETILTVVDPTGDRTVSLPNITGTVITTGDTGTVSGTMVADNAIDSDHYTDGSIDNAHIADDAIDSEHYAAGSIDSAHLADDAVTLAKMAGLARGKIIYGNSSGNPTALAVGGDGTALISDGTDVSWGTAGAITSYTNSTNNRVVTSVDSSTVNSEANLTFDGSVLATTGNITATGTIEPAGDTSSGDNAAIGYTSAEGLILTGQGSTSDVTIKNDADATVISIPTGTTNVTIAGDLTISGDDLTMGTNTSGAALIADGTNFNPVVISGDISINTSGVAAIGSGVIVVADMAANSIDSAQYVDGSIDLAHMSDNSIDSDQYVDGSIDTAHIAADAITAAKIADDVINSEHYAAASIDNEHLADNAVDSAELAAGSVDLAHMSDNSVDSDQYVDASIDLAHMSANSVDSNQYVDASIDLAHMSADSVDSTQYVDGSIDTAHIADDQITLAKMAGLARGKIIYGDASGNPTALAVGGDGTALKSDGTDISWGTPEVTLTGSQTLTNKTLTSPSIGTGASLTARAPLYFYDSDSSNYVALRAGSTVASNVTWTLPTADGTADQLMKTDGAGNLSWGSASGAVTGFTNSTVTTCPGASGNYDLAEGTNQDGDETPFDAGAADAFAVSLGTVYDSMEPIGSTTTIDYGDGESYVGA